MEGAHSIPLTGCPCPPSPVSPSPQCATPTMWLSLRLTAVAASGGRAGGSAGACGGGCAGGSGESEPPPPPQPASVTPNRETTQARRAYSNDRVFGLKILL